MIFNRTVSIPTIEVRVLCPFYHGGRMLHFGDRVWFTDLDLAAHASRVRTILRVPRARIVEDIELAERFRR